MKHLCLDGETVVLHRFRGWPERESPRKGVPAIVLDTETTGLDHASNVVIEIGIRPFEFDADTGEILSVREAYSAMQDPGRPLSPDIVAITGLHDEDLAGQAIDWPKVRGLLDGAEIVVAHNAGFDRPFVEHALGRKMRRIWACSASQIDWDSSPAPSRSQEVLCVWHGFFSLEAHRALADADALLQLLSLSGRLPELRRRACAPSYRVAAVNSPFDTKDALKARGYRWDSAQRCWWIEVADEAAVEVETGWAGRVVYNGRFRGDVSKVEPWARFA